MQNLNLLPVILAGGSGTRLWPLSREEYPKQLLNLQGENTLLQETLRRLDGFRFQSVNVQVGFSAPVVACQEGMRFLVQEQLAAIDRPPQQLILEPVAKNTAPALTCVALTCGQAQSDPIMLVMPADHAVSDRTAFQKALQVAIEAAAKNSVVTFGIPPQGPETGFGYIRRGDLATDSEYTAFPVAGFYEKPSATQAREYLDSGEYYWNAGIFMLKASVWIEALERFNPGMLKLCRASVNQGSQDEIFFRLDAKAFGECPADSIDYAVMEHLADNSSALVVIPVEMGWSDVGAWPALMGLGEPDPAGNVIQGDVIAEDTRNSLLISQDRLLATLGLDDLIVVSTPDALLIARKDSAQDVRKIVDRLRLLNRDEVYAHRKVYRPWGSYEPLGAGDRYQVKRLAVKPGAKLSLQMHHHRAEHWVVVRGTAKVTRGEEEFLLTENQSTYISLGTLHRLENPGSVELEVIEVQSGSYLGEDDIVRFEDQYDRIPAKNE